MQIIRLVTIMFSLLPDAWTKWEAEIDSLKVSTLGHRAHDNSSLLLVKCQADVTGLLRVNETNEIVIPPDIISRIDKAIESAANLISVFEHSKRAISSPMPPVAFLPEDDAERKWLDSTAGINPLGAPILGVKFKLDPSLQTSVSDRLDGVALLAEAKAQEHPAGAFHELIRLFERAFILSSSSLVPPLGKFLEESHQGYTTEEVQEWLVDIRHPATHADRRDDFVAERGIRPVVRRMTQAAYDVLLNKLEWRSPSVTRRDVWKPEGGTAVPRGHKIFLAGKTPATFQATIMDAFESYPVNTDVGITNFLQKDWWTKPSGVRAKGADTSNGS